VIAMSLDQEMRGRVARYADRREDWTVFGFETKIDPKYARSQRRYIGESGSVDHKQTTAVQPAAFTMSIQTMPAGHQIPIHCHETEETFFILDGECTVNVFRDGETFSAKLGKWDLISIPPEVYHDISNKSDKPCAIQTLLSKPRPNRPHYQDPRLLDLQAATYTG
jgi:quercetin dioxygenase-like cupin family protein